MIIFTKYPYNILIFSTIYKIICCSTVFAILKCRFFFIIVTNCTTSGHKPQITELCSSFGEFIVEGALLYVLQCWKYFERKRKPTRGKWEKFFFISATFSSGTKIIFFFYFKGNICYLLHFFLLCICSSCSVIMTND